MGYTDFREKADKIATGTTYRRIGSAPPLTANDQEASLLQLILGAAETIRV